jgi:cellobiose transport system permease protein
VLYLYELGFPLRDFGRASATAWILFIIIVAVGLINFYLSRLISSQDGTKRARGRKAARA